MTAGRRPRPRIRLDTERLRLRPFAPDDRGPLAALCADPEVMRWFPAPLTRAQSDAFFDRIEARADQTGICFQAVERRSDGAFIGLAGLSYVSFDAPFGHAVEIGWRFAREAWGQGLATEAARAWLAHGFGPMALTRIVSFAVAGNRKSIAVMERIGLRRAAGGDFDHPAMPEGHPLRRHVLYERGRREAR